MMNVKLSPRICAFPRHLNSYLPTHTLTHFFFFFCKFRYNFVTLNNAFIPKSCIQYNANLIQWLKYILSSLYIHLYTQNKFYSLCRLVYFFSYFFHVFALFPIFSIKIVFFSYFFKFSFVFLFLSDFFVVESFLLVVFFYIIVFCCFLRIF